MRAAFVGTMLLAGCGGADATANGSAPVALPGVTAAGASAENPLIGVWSRISGAHCRFDQIEFAGSRMTAEATPSAPMRTVAVRYDLSDPQRPVATSAGWTPIRFRIIDATHLGDDADCVYAQAD